MFTPNFNAFAEVTMEGHRAAGPVPNPDECDDNGGGAERPVQPPAGRGGPDPDRPHGKGEAALRPQGPGKFVLKGDTEDCYDRENLYFCGEGFEEGPFRGRIVNELRLTLKRVR